MSQSRTSSSSRVSIDLRPRAASPLDLLGSSPEFGDFVDFQSRPRHDSSLDGIAGPSQHQQQIIRDAPLIDLMSDEPFPDQQWQPKSHEPLHIQLPPRPSEISPDYNPPLRSPRRLSIFANSGPGSPPQLSEIVFHPAQEAKPTALRNGQNGSAQSKLFSTLATTSRLANKWKSAADHNTFNQLSPHAGPTPTAQPIDISHSTPFAPWDRGFGSYIPPSGAPGFLPEADGSVDTFNKVKDFSGTSLWGRRDATEAVLSPRTADQLRQHLPSRRRISDRWTLLFSLDQHGSSLATLYRLIDNAADTHRGAGNVLIVRAGNGQLFGSYVNEMISKREGAYYGGGESFLFKIVDGEPKVFKWTGRNQYFALCESGFISFGGGQIWDVWVAVGFDIQPQFFSYLSDL